jgi:thiol-disulfide isomerase/thioredoxin
MMKAAIVLLGLVGVVGAFSPTRLLAPRVARVARAHTVAMLRESDQASWCVDVESAEKLTVVFFYAPWCRNCKAVRPKLKRIEKKYEDAAFFQINFKTQAELCYQQRVFNFPTVHFYLPGIGRVGRAVLTASNTDEKMIAALDRYLNGRTQLERLTAEAVRPVVQYAELVSALQGLATLGASEAEEGGASGFGAGLNPKKESARLRTMVTGDEERLAQLEQLFRSLDADADGRLQLSEVEAAVDALHPSGEASMVADELLASLRSAPAADVDRETFVALMVRRRPRRYALAAAAWCLQDICTSIDLAAAPQPSTLSTRGRGLAHEAVAWRPSCAHVAVAWRLLLLEGAPAAAPGVAW